jgi:hypothetical protein
MTGFWDEADVIHVYTRRQAIDDGVLVDVSETAREAGFTVPVALTAGVYALVEPSQEEKTAWGQDADGRLWDVLSMARFAIRARRHEGAELLYSVLFQIRGRQGERSGLRKFQLKLHSGPGDDGEHVITIMLPHGD